MAVPALFEHKNIEELCRLTIDGMTMDAIAQQWRCRKSDIYYWMHANDGFTKKFLDAKIIAAAHFDEQAFLAIQLASNMLELAKAREIAQHLRWRAKMYARGTYADQPETVKPETPKAESFVVALPPKADDEDQWRSSTQPE